MAHIGTFTRTPDGFSGYINTFMVKRQVVIIVPAIATEAENAPNYRILADDAEIGAGWKRRGDKVGDYVSLALDDPSFVQPLRANLFPATSDGNTFHLIWTRPARRQTKT